MTTIHEPAVDALDVDAPAAAQLAKDVPNATVVRTDGCTYICFADRDDFLAACGERLIEITNPFDIKTQGRNVYAPVLFGKDGQWRWEAMAVFPAQNPCDCGAETVHQLGCSAVEYPEPAMFADIPVLVIDVPRHTPVAGVVHYGSSTAICNAGINGVTSALTTLVYAVTCMDCRAALDLPRRIPGATTDVHYTNLGLRAAPACGAKKPTVLATVVAANVTCPDCTALLPAPVEPITRFLRNAYSPERAAEARDLASVLIEEKAE